MAEAQKGGEQSMDDILASIRRIISDDPVSPSPAAAGDASRPSGQLGGQGNPGFDEKFSDGAMPAAGPDHADDLSDILEPSTVRSAESDGAGGSAGTPHETTSWSFDAGGAAAIASAGSLKSKLASLDGAGQAAVSLSPIAAPTGEQIMDQSLDEGSRAVQPVVTGEGTVGTSKFTAEPVRRGSKSLVGDAVPASSGLATSTLERLATEPLPEEEAAAPATTMTADAVTADFRKPELIDVPVASETNTVSVERNTSTDLPVPARDSDAGAPEPTAVPEKLVPDVVVGGGKTLEALVGEALEPILRDWLDAHLPRLVEEKLQAEIDRSNRAGNLKSS